MPSIPCPVCGETACMRAGGEECVNQHVPRYRPGDYQPDPERQKSRRGKRGKQIEPSQESPTLDANAGELPNETATGEKSDQGTPKVDPDELGDETTITEINPGGEGEADQDASLYGPTGKK